MKRYLIALLLCGCTVSVTPIASKHYYVVSHAHHRTSKSASKTSPRTESVSVNGDWVERYRSMENKVHFTISDDSKIKAEGDHFKVPQTVIDHNEDLMKASPAP